MNIRVEVLYFAAARESAGVERELLELAPSTTLADLRGLLGRSHPSLARLWPYLGWAVNGQLSNPHCLLKDGDEVALIPPVAGGSGLLVISDRPLLLSEAIAAVSSPEHGAIITFQGIVRAHSNGRQVERLEFEAYQSMAIDQFQKISQEITNQLPVRIAIHHRVGNLSVGELALVIAVGASHRKEAFCACEKAIEQIKQEASIWKKEIFQDGSEQWVGLTDKQ